MARSVFSLTAEAMIEHAVKESKPMFLQGGVRQALDCAAQSLEAFGAVKGADDGEVKKLKAEG